VQVGDPFLEKLLLEACVEAMETGAVVGIQDMGAAGLTCSTCEMGARGHVGLEIELDLVPQRETGMTPYEIMLSESQERMLLVAEKGREEEVFAVFRKWGLDASTVGRVTSDGRMRVLHHGQVVAEIPNDALTDEAPVYQRPLARWDAPVPREKPEQVQLGAENDLTPNFERLLASPNICSKRWITEQYESYVQLVSTQRPGGDAGVLRVKGTERGLAMALDGNGRWCWLDPRLGAMHAVAEAARNVACAGARPIGATNCLNFGNPEKPHIMWQFSQVVDGMTKACEELETPITGGNVSFYNETLGEGIYPTPVVGIVGLIEHVDRAMTHDFREPGRAIVLLRGSEPGDAVDAEIEFGSSEYAKEIFGEVWGFPPALELEKEKALQDCIIDLVGLGLIDSAHDCSTGGLAVAVAESCFPREVGARLDLNREDLGSPDLLPEYLLFGEDASRIVISCVRENVPRIKEVAVKYGVAALPIGVTQSEKVEFLVDDRVVVSAPVSELTNSWEHALERALHTEAEERLAPEILQKS
jgi:phosphoribosylformylglycinamidine synthase